MKFNWNYPTTVWVGEDRVDDLGEACINLKIGKPLFVTDKDLIYLPFIQKILNEIRKGYELPEVFEIIGLVGWLSLVVGTSLGNYFAWGDKMSSSTE